MTQQNEYRLLDAGERALVVEFGSTVDPAINGKVLALDAALSASRVEGVRECVPTYRSLMIHYDPLVISRHALAERVSAIENAHLPSPKPGARWTLPCCYDPSIAEDIGQVQDLTGLGHDRIVALHSGATYRVYMYGFAPGYCYLGGLPKELAVSRRSTIRPPTPENVVLIGGGLSLVATISMPTGWYVVGRTAERMYAPERARPFLVDVGDEMLFEPVDLATFATLDARAAAGETVARREALS
ncbi:MAG: allophanate hydrolase subunit 1 [Hyphomicrobiales bacterium]|nr:allophanate hydrolase subunit 1 [Hyphomicrobiales bacterium]